METYSPAMFKILRGHPPEQMVATLQWLIALFFQDVFVTAYGKKQEQLTQPTRTSTARNTDGGFGFDNLPVRGIESGHCHYAKICSASNPEMGVFVPFDVSNVSESKKFRSKYPSSSTCE